VINSLNHSSPIVRLKAVMAVHSFVHKDPMCVVELFPALCCFFSDDNISIVNAVVNTLNCLLVNRMNINPICELLPDILRYFDRILSGNSNMEYYHQRVLAPFNLHNIFQFFSNIGPHVPDLDSQIQNQLSKMLQSFHVDLTCPSSLLYEMLRLCVQFNLTSFPQIKPVISEFMKSPNFSYKFIGLLQVLPAYTTDFQDIILDCLDYLYHLIRLRNLRLLHAMANEANAQTIVMKMLDFFQKKNNVIDVRIELADQISSLANKFFPNPIWFAKIMQQLLTAGGNLISSSILFSIIELIEKNCDQDTQRSIVDLSIDISQNGSRLSNVFV
jgi:AP-4 complex subunit epsilon-1